MTTDPSRDWATAESRLAALLATPEPLDLPETPETEED